jgi:hypothetical protein
MQYFGVRTLPHHLHKLNGIRLKSVVANTLIYQPVITNIG